MLSVLILSAALLKMRSSFHQEAARPQCRPPLCCRGAVGDCCLDATRRPPGLTRTSEPHCPRSHGLTDHGVTHCSSYPVKSVCLLKARYLARSAASTALGPGSHVWLAQHCLHAICARHGLLLRHLAVESRNCQPQYSAPLCRVLVLVRINSELNCSLSECLTPASKIILS